METLNLSKYQNNMFEALASVLHLGNIQFSQITKDGMESVSIGNEAGTCRDSTRILDDPDVWFPALV